jgi:hypothetical protein
MKASALHSAPSKYVIGISTHPIADCLVSHSVWHYDAFILRAVILSLFALLTALSCGNGMQSFEVVLHKRVSQTDTPGVPAGQYYILHIYISRQSNHYQQPH